MRDNNIFNRKNLEPIRKSLRQNSTSAEVSLWNLLKSRKLDGRKFRRQHSIGQYVVDFYCPSEKLVIELDGDPHGNYIQIEKDINRDKYLEELGITVKRFENRVVFQEPDYLLNEIKKEFQNNSGRR